MLLLLLLFFPGRADVKAEGEVGSPSMEALKEARQQEQEGGLTRGEEEGLGRGREGLLGRGEELVFDGIEENDELLFQGRGEEELLKLHIRSISSCSLVRG